MYFFLKTVVDGGRNRLRALPKQVFPSGMPVDTTLNIQSDRVIRSQYPIGTVFVTEELALDASKATGFYTAGKIYPVSTDTDFVYVEDGHKPTEAMLQAYLRFIGLSGSEGIHFEEPTKPVTGSSHRVRKTLRERLVASKEFQVPTVENDKFYVSSDNWYLLIRNLLNQVNTMLLGPTGTGKTEIVLLACKKLGLECCVYDMGSMYDPIAGLLGVHRLQQGGSVFDYAKFTRDIQKPCVILLDELSRAPVTTNNILFPCLDSRRMLPVEIAGGEDTRAIKVHPECTFVATANVGAEYTGTMSMDRALVNRFFPMELDYMPAEEEISVLIRRCSLPREAAAKVIHAANNIRSLFKKQEISACVSTRETLIAGQLVADGWTPLKAMELVFLPLFEGTRSEGERGMVLKNLMSA